MTTIILVAAGIVSAGALALSVYTLYNTRRR